MPIQFSSSRGPAGSNRRRSPLFSMLAAALLAGAQVLAVTSSATAQDGAGTLAIPIQSLDGTGNNVANPTWGAANTPYSRVAPARYADGRSQPVGGPNSRAISNRVFNDSNQNLFSERQVTAWGWTWGQFLDHTFGLREGRLATDPDGEVRNIPFNANDPLEDFENDLGNIGFVRSFPAPGTGVTNPRQQINTVSSYIDAAAVYGVTNQRLDWLREGSVDGNPTNNNGRLLLQNNFLPRRDARGNPAAAPFMEIDGILRANPNRAMVAGDGRANENLFLTATHTLFAREHNRIVNSLPSSLTEEQKFQIARRIVIAEQQYITYNEWLPSMGVSLPAYTGYRPTVNASLSNEFATVGYRVHSMIHGEMEVVVDAGRYTDAQLDAFRAQGIEIVEEDGEVELVIPLNRGFFNPDLLPAIGLPEMLLAVGGEPQYKNEEMIDNQLRSVLFQIPVSGNPGCLDGPELPECFDAVADLGAIDVERGRDHGMPSYNQMRQAYGLPARTSFTAITGESSSSFPPGTGPDDPDSLAFTSLTDVFNAEVDRNDPDAVEGTPINFRRAAPLAARLQALYGGNVNNVDAFVGALAERHASGSELGELQRAIWAREFTRLRDGDRFFYGNDPGLTEIRNLYGIDFRRSLGDIIAQNTGLPRTELPPNVFFDRGFVPPSSCVVTYRIVDVWSNGFRVDMSITNNGSVPLNNWALRWVFPEDQVIQQLWNGVVVQDGIRVEVTNAPWNAAIAPGQTLRDVGFVASRNGLDLEPEEMGLNTTRCSIL
jgi:hypothetical protein